ncbi:MAG: HEAT repeat domain-containing protein, partial [Candidatus Heimdallarchaeota archaeon]
MSFNPDTNMIQKQLNQIIQEMNSRRSNIRAKAIKGLGQMDLQIEEIPISLHKKLEHALFDPAATVRKEAVMALAFLEGEIALPLLEPLLDDSNQSVRSTTIAALSYIGICPKAEVLEKMIAYLNAPEPEIRDRVARALGRLNVLQAKDHLLDRARNDP